MYQFAYRFVILCVLFLSVICTSSGAVEFTVDSPADAVDLNPGDGICLTGNATCTLRAAIQEANALEGYDIINLPSGNYVLSLIGRDEDHCATGDLDIRDSLDIKGSGSLETLIDGGQIDRVFEIPNSLATYKTVRLIDLTIQNGDAAEQNGGGIYSFHNLQLENVAVASNSANTGGGVYSVGSLTASNTFFYNNTATGEYGGGAFSTGCNITDCIFDDNSAPFGGGLYMSGGTHSISRTVFRFNEAAERGGGLYSYGAGEANVTLANVTVRNNTATNFGGGIGMSSTQNFTFTDGAINDNNVTEGVGGGISIAQVGCDATFERTGISNNVSKKRGGGIYQDYGSLTLNACMVKENASVEEGGGGIQNYSGTLVFTNTTISGNSAHSYGGGLRNNLDGTATLTNCTVSNNTALSSSGGIDNNQSTCTLKNTIIANNSGGISNDNCGGTWLITSDGHNIENANSCRLSGTGDIVNTDPKIGPLADNGGPTETHALLVGSPAIDAGDNMACPATDQRGRPRPYGAACDIGAFELVLGKFQPAISIFLLNE